MAAYWICTTTEITKSFQAWTIVFNVIMKIKFVGTELLNKLHRNTRRHQNTRKPMRMLGRSMNEWLTRLLGNLLLDYDFISCSKAMKAVLYLH
jgi:hypothetical protein